MLGGTQKHQEDERRVSLERQCADARAAFDAAITEAQRTRRTGGSPSDVEAAWQKFDASYFALTRAELELYGYDWQQFWHSSVQSSLLQSTSGLALGLRGLREVDDVSQQLAGYQKRLAELQSRVEHAGVEFKQEHLATVTYLSRRMGQARAGMRQLRDARLDVVRNFVRTRTVKGHPVCGLRRYGATRANRSPRQAPRRASTSSRGSPRPEDPPDKPQVRGAAR